MSLKSCLKLLCCKWVLSWILSAFHHFLSTLSLSALISAVTFCNCSPTPSHYFSTSSLSRGISPILLIDGLAASLGWLVEPSGGQDPYSCDISEFCVVMWTDHPFLGRFYDRELAFSLHLSSIFSLRPPTCSRWGETRTLSSVCFFFFSNFPFQSYRPGHPNPPTPPTPKSISVLLSYSMTPYYLPHWSLLPLRHPSKYLLPSLGHHLTSLFLPGGKLSFFQPPGPLRYLTERLRPQSASELLSSMARLSPDTPDLPACGQRVGFLSPA